MQLPKSILITGASSGVGDALARLYARSGIALFLSGRNAERLAALADICKSMHYQSCFSPIAMPDCFILKFTGA